MEGPGKDNRGRAYLSPEQEAEFLKPFVIGLSRQQERFIGPLRSAWAVRLISPAYIDCLTDTDGAKRPLGHSMRSQEWNANWYKPLRGGSNPTRRAKVGHRRVQRRPR